MKCIKALHKSLPVLQSCPSVQPACRWGRSLRPRQLWMPPLKRNNIELLISFFHEKYTVRAKFKLYLRRSSCQQGRTAAWSYLRSSNLFLQEEKPIWLFKSSMFFQCIYRSLQLISINRQMWSDYRLTWQPWPFVRKGNKRFPTSWHHNLGTRQLGAVAFCQILL